MGIRCHEIRKSNKKRRTEEVDKSQFVDMFHYSGKANKIFPVTDKSSKNIDIIFPDSRKSDKIFPDSNKGKKSTEFIGECAVLTFSEVECAV